MMKRNFPRRMGALLLTLVLALSLAAPAWAAVDPNKLNVTLSLSNSSMKVGETVTLTADVTPDAAAEAVFQYHWTTSDPSVIELPSGDYTDSGSSSNITLTPSKAGTTTITVTVTEWTTGDSPSKTGRTGTAELIVKVDPAPTVPVTGVTLNHSTLSLLAGATGQLNATVSPSNATDKTVTWESDDEGVATVDETGAVTAVAAGEAVITATAGGKSAACTVTVSGIPVSSITISTYNTGNNPVILDKVGQGEQIHVSVSPENATDKTVTWKVVSDDDDESEEKGKLVAEVDSDGYVIANGVGRAIVIAKAGAAEARCAVEVSGVVLSATELFLTLDGKTYTPTFEAYGNASAKQGTTVQRYWQSSDPLVAAVNRTTGTITPRGVGDADITFTYVVNGEPYFVPSIHVTVTEDISTILLGNATAGAPYLFSEILKELNAKSPYGSLVYITNLLVPTKEGVLYYNHISSDDTGFGVGATERYYYNETTVGERYMSGLTFVPNSDFNGDTTITFTGYTSDKKTYSGKVRLTVTGSGNVTFITKAGQPLVFSSANFSAACRSETGREVNNVSFVLPDEGKGLFCYNYSGGGYRYEVTEQEQYFRSRAPYLDQVAYLPAEFYMGTFRLPFYAEDTVGVSFTGQLNIIVVPNSPQGEYKELTYQALKGTSVDFGKFDFGSVCRQVLGSSESLSYVRFTPPASSAGTLYYNYSSSGSYDSLVNANTRYYPSSKPKLADLTFVPAYGRMEPVSISFEGYSSSGKSFKGVVTIYYRDEGSDGVISYAATSGQAIPFEPSDFSALCQEITGRDLNYITFQYLPDTWEGTLYRNYNSGSSTGTKVTTKDRIYRSSLSGVAFAPRSDFTGTVELEFAGYAAGTGERFNGTVRIVVEEGNATLHYSVYSGASVYFSAEDFNTVCKQATGGKLNYVRFQLPQATQGTLYYRSSTTSTTKSKVSAGSSYYYSTTGSNRIGNVLFTAASNYTGTVSIQYTGFSTSGARFDGTAEIDVSYHHGTTFDYTATSLPFTIPGSELVAACRYALVRDFSYIVFTSLPKAEQGRLYYDYVGYNTGLEVKLSTKYYENKAPYLNRIVFVPKEGYAGSVSIPYTAYDTLGDTVSGVVRIEVVKQTVSSFSDMGGYGWAIPSVEFLDKSGVVEGIGSGKYNPSGNIRRGDFVLMLFRTYNFSDAGTKSFSDVPEDSYYARAIASAKAKNIVAGENGMFRPNEPITRQDAMLFLRNAMKAAGKSIPTGSASILYTFADYNSISSEARSAIISMIELDIIRGDTFHRINPTNFITRAEAAALMHRAMTL